MSKNTRRTPPSPRRTLGSGRLASIIAFGYVGYLTWDNYSLLGGPSTTARWRLAHSCRVCLAAGYALGQVKPSISYDAQQF